MSRTIWKYELAIFDSQLVEMPEDAIILSVQEQNGKPCLWAIVNPENKRTNIEILIHGTGHPIDDAMNLANFIGTVQCGSLVWHVFTK